MDESQVSAINICSLLAQAIPPLEQIAPLTPTKFDDMVLLGFKGYQSWACQDDEQPSFGIPEGTDEEVAQGAQLILDGLKATFPCDA